MSDTNKRLKLIREEIDFSEIERKIIVENETGLKHFKLQGPFLQAEVKNKNGRIYKNETLLREVTNFQEKIKRGNSYGELEHPNCSLSKEFDVLTKEGWKTFIDLKEGEEVYSLDIETGNMVLNKINKIINEPYKGKGYKVIGRNFYGEYTPTHRFLTQNRDGKYEYHTIETIYNNRSKFSHHSIPKKANFIGNDSESFIIKGLQNEIKRTTFNQTNDLVFDTLTFVRLLGFWLAEGSCVPNRGSISVCQSHKNKKVIELIDEIFNNLPKDLNITKNVNKKLVVWNIYDKRIANWFSKISGMYTKYIPEEVKQLDSKYLEELVYYFALGDGRKSNFNGKTYKILNIFATSKRLMNDLQECNIKSGGSGNLTILDYSNLEGGYNFADHVILYENKKPLYQVALSTTNNISLDKRMLNIEEIDHDDNVYCINVDHSNFMIRYKGKVYWTGNSPAINGQNVAILITELKMNSNIGYGKATVLETIQGRNVRAMMEAGGAIGMSTRGLGTMTGDIVNSDFRLVTADAVIDPSAPDCYVEGILENKEYIIQGNRIVEAAMYDFQKKLANKGNRPLVEILSQYLKGIFND